MTQSQHCLLPHQLQFHARMHTHTHTHTEREIDFVGTEEDQHCGQETLLMYPKNKVRAQEQLGHKEGQNAWGRMS